MKNVVAPKMVSWVEPLSVNEGCKEITDTMHTSHQTSILDMLASQKQHFDALRTFHGSN